MSFLNIQKKSIYRDPAANKKRNFLSSWRRQFFRTEYPQKKSEHAFLSLSEQHLEKIRYSLPILRKQVSYSLEHALPDSQKNDGCIEQPEEEDEQVRAEISRLLDISLIRSGLNCEACDMKCQGDSDQHIKNGQHPAGDE